MISLVTAVIISHVSIIMYHNQYFITVSQECSELAEGVKETISV